MPRGAAELCEQLDDRRAPGFGTGRQELAHEIVAVAVDDEPGQAVGLREHEPAARLRGSSRLEAPPRLDGACEAPAEERGIDALAGFEAPNARADLRGRRIAPRGRAARRDAADDFDGCAGVGLAVDPLDRSREHPRMPAPQRFLAAWLEPNLRVGAVTPMADLARSSPSAAARPRTRARRRRRLRRRRGSSGARRV